MNNLEQIVAQYYTDYDGNPMSYHIIRKFQISPNNYQIQLDGVYDKHKGVEVIEPDNMFRVKNHDELSKNKYFVRADGNVFFDESMAGKTVKVDYYSIGLPCIGAGRIYTLLDDKGNVIETLQDIIQAGQLAIESLKTFGDVKIVIDEIKTSQYLALKCKQSLDEGIDEARYLFDKLNATDFVQKNQFTQMVGNFNEKVAELYKEINKNKALTDGAFTEVKTSIVTANEKISENKKITDKAFTDVKKTFNDFENNLLRMTYCNMVSNPIFNTGDLTNWEIWGNGTSWAVRSDTSLSHNYSVTLQCFKNEQGLTQTISGLRYGKIYTFKASVKVEDGLPGIMVRNDNTWNGVTFKPEQGYNKWIELSFTFMAKEGTTPIYIGNVNNNTTSTFWVSEVMLYEGSLDMPFIDNVKENYTPDFQTDKEGIRCKLSDGSCVKMDKDNFAMYKDGTSYPYHCLIEQGTVNNLSFNNGVNEHRVTLPNAFKGKHFTVFPALQGWNFPDGQVQGTMTTGCKDLDYANGQFTIYFNAGMSNKINCNIGYLAIA